MKEFGMYLLILGTTGILVMFGVFCFMVNGLVGLAYLFLMFFIIGIMLFEIGED